MIESDVNHFRTPSEKSRVFYNVLGGSLTLLSLQLPWLTIGGVYSVTISPSGLYTVTFYWILAGTVLSFVSRYGGVFTLLGVLSFLAIPLGWGSGMLLALTGALFTLAGARFSIPREMFRGREILGGIVFSVGFLILLTLSLGIFVYGSFVQAFQRQLIVQFPLFLVGTFMTGIGLRMYLSQSRTQYPVELLDKRA